jgi:hypothetical protein
MNELDRAIEQTDKLRELVGLASNKAKELGFPFEWDLIMAGTGMRRVKMVVNGKTLMVAPNHNHASLVRRVVNCKR